MVGGVSPPARAQPSIAAVCLCVVAGVGIFSGVPSALSPWPALTLVPAVLLHSSGAGIALTLFCVSALWGGLSYLWLRSRLRRPQFGISVPLVIVLFALSVTQYGYFLFMRHWFEPSPDYFFFAAFPAALAVVGLMQRRRIAAGMALTWHALCVGWLIWGFLPYLGELP